MSKETTGGGIGLVGILTILFVVAKVLGYITWSWWLVFAPIWISWIVLFAILLFIFACIVLAALSK